MIAEHGVTNLPEQSYQAPIEIGQHAIINAIQAQCPALLALYAFGSRISGYQRPNSDLDLAVLVAGYADPLVLWTLANDLVDIVHCPVDLLDLRAASTVMQYQVLATGCRWWAKDVQAGLFEAFVFSEKMRLDAARAPLIAEIIAKGRVYDR